ncbi:MAG: hypothetical protein WBH59_02730 [Atribacterales bacterium]
MTDDVDASLNLENDGKRECIFYLSFLSGSIRNPNNGRGHALSFPIEGRKEKAKTWMPEWFYCPLSVTPEWFYEGSKLYNSRKNKKHKKNKRPLRKKK